MQFSDLETFKVGFSIDPLQQGEAILQNSPGYEGFQGTVDQSSSFERESRDDISIFVDMFRSFQSFIYLSFLN
jgi:hypothetical protein